MTGRGRNSAALERTLAALRNVGRIEPADAAVVAMARTLAAIIDAHDEPVTQVAYAYLSVLRQLRPEVVTETRDDDLAAFLTVLQAQMGDAKES
jgi:hypothetical protein